jgi:hypothetical protein
MSHAHIALLDNALRGAWFGQGPFGLSQALRASASLKQAYRDGHVENQRDSSGTGKAQGRVGLTSGSAGTIVRGLWWVRNGE